MKYILILLMTIGFAYGQQGTGKSILNMRVITPSPRTTTESMPSIFNGSLSPIDCGVPKHYEDISEWELIGAGDKRCVHWYVYKEKEFPSGVISTTLAYNPCPTYDRIEEECRICKSCGNHERRTIKTGIRYIPKGKTAYELAVEKFKP